MLHGVSGGQIVLEGFGHPDKQEVSLDSVKRRFFKLGLQIGMSLQMFFMAVIVMFLSYDQRSGAIYELSHEYYPLFRGMFLFLFFGVCYGLILFICKRYGVDYESVLGVGPEHNYHYVIRTSSTLLSVVFLMFILYVFSLTIDVGIHFVSKHVWPMMAVASVIVLLLWPSNMTEWKGRAQRYSLVQAVFAILASPFSEPYYSRIFLADVLTSMPKIFADVQFTACLYITGEAFDESWIRAVFDVHVDIEEKCSDVNPTYKAIHVFLACLPFWLRLMQCIRLYAREPLRKYLGAGLKFALSIVVVVLSFKSGYRRTWRHLAVVYTLYNYFWDVCMEWGLGPAPLRRAIHGEDLGGESGDFLLRPLRVYPKEWYYVAMVFNGVARLGSFIYISPGQVIFKQHFVLILGCVEIIRRSMSNVFKLEMYHFYYKLKKQKKQASYGKPNTELASVPFVAKP